MSDLSEQQVLMADAVAGGKVSGEQQRQKQVKELVDSLLGARFRTRPDSADSEEVEGLSIKELEKFIQ